MDDQAGAAVAARMRWTGPQRLALGRRLLEHRRERGYQRRMAEALGVSTRWLRELARRAERGTVPAPPGRPRKPEGERAWVREQVARELDAQGTGAGEAAVLRGIQARAAPGTRVSLLLVRQELAREKRRRRARTRQELEAVRESHDVLARDAIWCHDGTHLGRLLGAGEVHGEVVQDRCTLATVGLSVGGPITGEAALALIDRCARERGGWPLALQEDNARIHEAVDRVAAEHRCVVLRSRVHTPTDNPAVEHRNAELKAETGLGAGVLLGDAATARGRLDAARRCLDHGRLRATRGWRTADEMDAMLPRADALVDRDTFYAHATTAMGEAERAVAGASEKCRARQRAFWATLERFGLARTHVGPRPRVRPAPTPFLAGPKEVQ
jgi:hypothetical protein